MRQWHHLTPRYIYDRVKVERFLRAQGPNCPSLAIQAVDFLRGWLRSSDRMLEYGSGASTKWFGERVGELISVENDPVWFARVSEQTASLRNVKLHLFDGAPEPSRTGGQVSSAYLEFARAIPDESFTVMLDDGWARYNVALEAIRVLKPGGLLVWDDIDAQELRSSPLAEIHRFLEAVAPWRQVYFDDGVHPSALFFKP